MGEKVRTSLLISKEKREKIRGTGLSLEEYFNAIQEKYEHFNMDKWDEGSFWIGHFRICLLRAETLNFLLDHLEEESLRTIGRSVGEKLRSTMKMGFDLKLDSGTSLEIVEYFNTFSGWGHLSVENESIIVTTPIFNKSNFLQGYIEGLFNLELTLLESHPDRFIFKRT
jgi:hypothetical protein